MPNPIVWTSSISAANLGTAPTAVDDPNVLSASGSRSALTFSATITGGTAPTLTVTLYFYNPVTMTFERTGDSFILDPATANLQVIDPNGLLLGITATATGSPSDYTVQVGQR